MGGALTFVSRVVSLFVSRFVSLLVSLFVSLLVILFASFSFSHLGGFERAICEVEHHQVGLTCPVTDLKVTPVGLTCPVTDLKVTPADDAIYGGHGPVLHNKYQPLEEQEDDDEIPIMVISSAGTAAPRA